MEPTSDLEQRLVAWSMAHRVILAYLIKAVGLAIPEEATPQARDATVTMLHNSIPPFMTGIDGASAEILIAAAQQEIDRIFSAPFRPAPPSSAS